MFYNCVFHNDSNETGKGPAKAPPISTAYHSQYGRSPGKPPGKPPGNPHSPGKPDCPTDSSHSTGSPNTNTPCSPNTPDSPPCKPHKPCCVPPSPAIVRQNEAYCVRVKAAYKEFIRPLPDRPTNGDEELYPNRIASFSKALPHNRSGVVDPSAYQALLFALQTQEPSDFDVIPMGANPSVLLVNPQAAFAFDLEGADSASLAILPAPTFDSAQQASETVELYNMALMRDVNFDEYDISILAANAVIYLNECSDFRGPKINGLVTTRTLFRGNLSGTINGPFVSQFLYQPFAYGALSIVNKSRKTTVDADYLTTFADWLPIQNGEVVAQPLFPDVRHIINARDLAEYVHVDAIYEAYLNALLYLLGIKTPLNPGNPYINNPSQIGFSTFGDAHVLTLVAEVANRALKAAWSQKWLHRRARPEAFCSRVDLTKDNLANDPINSDLLNSQVLPDVKRKWGTYLLPTSFIEGSPAHPSYPAGHAAMAGACVTLLKAWFDTTGFIPNPVQPSTNGDFLNSYCGCHGSRLNIQDELHKLATNITTGRNMAGIHYRSDSEENSGLELGEAVCISVLRDQNLTFNENFAGFTFQKFDGTTITV